MYVCGGSFSICSLFCLCRMHGRGVRPSSAAQCSTVQLQRRVEHGSCSGGVGRGVCLFAGSGNCSSSEQLPICWDAALRWTQLSYHCMGSLTCLALYKLDHHFSETRSLMRDVQGLFLRRFGAFCLKHPRFPAALQYLLAYRTVCNSHICLCKIITGINREIISRKSPLPHSSTPPLPLSLPLPLPFPLVPETKENK